MRYLPFVVLGALSLCGCNETNRSATDTTARSAGAANSDNTAVNARDRDATAKTPLDQNENQADLDITANIRKRVVATKMSVDAQNVKIITQDGKVTLRGPVKSADEKQQIDQLAIEVAGADNVDSQLEVE